MDFCICFFLSTCTREHLKGLRWRKDGPEPVWAGELPTPGAGWGQERI